MPLIVILEIVFSITVDVEAILIAQMHTIRYTFQMCNLRCTQANTKTKKKKAHRTFYIW